MSPGALESTGRGALDDHDCDVYTIAVTLPHAAYLAAFPPAFQKFLSQYTLCFLGCALGNHQIAQANDYHGRVSIFVEKGNKFLPQVQAAHTALYDAQENGGQDLGLGSLTPEDDHRVTALQAADVICWAVRRRISKYSLKGGYEPLLEILSRQGHNESPMPEADIFAIKNAIKMNHPEMNL